MKNITLKKEDIGKGELVLINPDYTLKSTINNLVSFDEEYNNIKLNNIPGCTSHSRYPSMLKEIGIPFEEVIDRLIELGWEK